MNDKLKMALAMAVFGTIALFVRNIPLSSGEIALYRALIAIAVLGLWRALKGPRFEFASIKRDLPALFLSGAAMGFNWILLFEAYKHTTVSVATLSYYFAPVLVTLLCPILFKEKLTPLQIACFIGSTAGLVLLVDARGGANITGVLFGLGAAALYASVIIINKYIKNVSGLDRTLLQFIAAAAVLAPYVLLTSGINIAHVGAKGLINLAVVGVIHTGVMYFVYFSALGGMSGPEAAVLSYIDPLVAVAVSVALLHESVSAAQIIGGAMVLGFTVPFNTPMPPSRRARRGSSQAEDR